MQKFLLWIIGFLFFLQGNAQRAKGTWQDYLSYSNATKVVVTANKTYCVTEGGLFSYDREDNSINKFSALNGLSDFGISSIAYSEANQVLVIAYENSNIDLVRESGIINLPDIKRKQMTGDKSINNISFVGNDALLACGFGIVVLNLDRNEVKDTYFIGQDGGALRINDVVSDGQFLYAATDEGILRVDSNSPNLLDHKNWSKIEDIPHANEKFSHLAVYNGNIIASYTRNEENQDIMYSLEDGIWNTFLPEINNVNDIQAYDNYLVVTGHTQVYIIDDSNIIVGNIGTSTSSQINIWWLRPRSAGISSDGSIWIADYGRGLIRISNTNVEEVSPGGPPDNQIFTLYSNNGDLWVLPGGRNDAWNNTFQHPRFQLFRNSEWKSFTKDQFPELDGFFDIVCMVADPNDPNHIFVGSWGGGVLEFQGEQLLNRFTNLNSPLATALPQQPDEPYVRIGGLDFDSDGNLWITNSEVPKNLVKRTPSGEWESFALPEVANQRNIGQIIVTENDDKWILVPRGHDAYVVDKTGEQKRQLPVVAYFNNGVNEIETPMNDVYSIAEDNNGEIWIGTSKGVAVYSSPERIWQSETFYATQPGLDLNDGIYHPLLATETVTAIAVDGGNRKWVGTKSSGVYLISENGEKELEHFTQENSPLLSNTITTIAINQKSGEVFFGTNEGLVSYMGDATGANDAFENVYVYPNPVRETYNGPVTITGLMDDTDLKITDITGNLVYSTTSLGGQAVWDGKNLNGNRVRTGVYMIFCTNKDGSQTHIAKLLFIN